MGSKLQQGIPELDVITLEMAEHTEKTAVSQKVSAIPRFPYRNGITEEAYFDSTFLPLPDVYGHMGGLYNSTAEVTKQKISERRAAMFNYMANPSAVNSGTLAGHVMPQLESNPLDITMALLYEVDEESVPGIKHLHLCGNIGFLPGHHLLVNKAKFKDPRGLVPLFSEDNNEIVTLPVNSRFENVKWRGFGKSSHFSILPITSPGRVFGFLVIGVNPYRPIDNDHRRFIWDLAAKISTIAASVSSAANSRRRSQQLENELKDRVTQIQYMAKHASVGMFHTALDQRPIWANEQYYQLVGRSREEMDYPSSFLDTLLDEDRPKAEASWNRVVHDMANDSVELRLKSTFITPSGDRQHASVLVLKFPHLEGGVIKSVMACMTDVSRLKWAESLETKKAVDAQAAKKQQEEFIDIVSHEMRNPLSAIFQCADMIRLGIEECEEKGYSTEAVQETLTSSVENSAVISLCAQHQKRIVDDVLTLSKMDHMMLLISPRPTQPLLLIQEAVKMFQADIEAHDIKVAINPEASLDENRIDWVQCDPSRVSQVLINLLTNGIKFTRGESRREITIRCGATLSAPRNGFQEAMRWAPKDQEAEDVAIGPEWGSGEVIYLLFSVSDTGVGMTHEEIMKLFSRFNQANSRTSIKYGGTGLGLFISQRLTEKQGGEIGVASIPKKGSIFGFYVKARRTDRGTPSTRSSSSWSGESLRDVDLNAVNVLLVEDDVVNQKILRKQLSHAGCHVDVANNGMEALKILSNSDIWYEAGAAAKHLDIVLMDWEMPVMDGLAATREIRSMEKVGKITGHVKIIAITGNAREEQMQSVMKSGAVSLSYCAYILIDSKRTGQLIIYCRILSYQNLS